MLFKKEKYFAVIEIEETLIKFVVSETRNSKWELVKAGRFEFSFENIKGGQVALKELFAEFKKQDTYVILCIPRRHFTTRNMKIPSFDELEIRNILELQATRQIPYAREEIVMDFKVIEKFPDGFSNVFFAIAHQNVIKKRLEILYNLGINVDLVSISTEGAWLWFLMQQFSTKPSLAILNMDRNNAEIIITGSETFEFSRSFSYRPENMDKFIEEIKLTFSSYYSEKDIKIEDMVLSGSKEGIEIDRIERELNLKIHPLPQFNNILISPELEQKIGDFEEDSYLELIGTAFNPGSMTLNFLPKDIVISRELKFLKWNLLISAALLISVVLSSGSAIYIKIKEKSDIVNQIETRLKSLEPEVSRINKIAKNLEVIKNQLNPKGSALDIIREIYRIIPGDIYLTSLNFEEGKDIVLKGDAPSLSKALKLVKSFEDSEYFENVKLKYATNRQAGGREFTDFEINAPLKRINSGEIK